MRSPLGLCVIVLLPACQSTAPPEEVPIDVRIVGVTYPTIPPSPPPTTVAISPGRVVLNGAYLVSSLNYPIKGVRRMGSADLLDLDFQVGPPVNPGVDVIAYIRYEATVPGLASGNYRLRALMRSINNLGEGKRLPQIIDTLIAVP